MQQKYLDQFYMLYDDFNITKLPLLPQEVGMISLSLSHKIIKESCGLLCHELSCSFGATNPYSLRIHTTSTPQYK